MKQIFREQGLLKRGISNNGPHYNLAVFKQFAKEWGFDHCTSSPKYPQNYGLAECCVQLMKSGIKKAKSSSCDIVLLCPETTLIDHTIPSQSKLLLNSNNILVKFTNHNT